jgi:hypothetical protein
MDMVYNIFNNLLYGATDIYYTIYELLQSNYNNYIAKDTVKYDFKNNTIIDTHNNIETSVLTTLTNKDYIVRFFCNNTHDGEMIPDKQIMYFGFTDQNGSEVDLTDLINTFFIPNAILDFSKKNMYKWRNIINHAKNITINDHTITWTIITNDGDIHDLPYFKIIYNNNKKIEILPIE